MRKSTLKAIDAWQAELEGLDGFKSDEGMTADEIAEELDCGIGKARKTISGLFKHGRVTLGFRQGTRIDGQKVKVPVYSLKGKR